MRVPNMKIHLGEQMKHVNGDKLEQFHHNCLPSLCSSSFKYIFQDLLQST